MKFNDNRYLTPEALEEIKKRIQATISERGILILDDLKEILGYGRTRGIPILEYLDEIGFTVRLEHGRVLKSTAVTPESYGENVNPEQMLPGSEGSAQPIRDRSRVKTDKSCCQP